jgi:hypothetical protein
LELRKVGDCSGLIGSGMLTHIALLSMSAVVQSHAEYNVGGR